MNLNANIFIRSVKKMSKATLFKNRFTSFYIIEENGYVILRDNEYWDDSSVEIEISPYGKCKIETNDEDKNLILTLNFIPNELKNLDNILHLKSFALYLIKKYFFK
jgi:hypothetical protein